MAVPDSYMYTSALLAAETGKDWEYALHLLGSSPSPLSLSLSLSFSPAQLFASQYIP